MFLRQYTRKKSGKVHRYWALVESLRTEEGPRQRVVAHLGELNHSQQRRWQRTVVFYNRHGDAEQLRLFPNDPGLSLPDEPDIVRVRLSSTGWTNARAFGDVWLGLWLWRLLKLDEIVARHLPAGRHTVRPADVVAIEVINRLCAPSSEFALAEHWYASTGLEDLLGIPDREITKDRLYRTLDGLRQAKEAIENDLKEQLGTLFRLEYDVLLYDLTSSYFEGLAEENPLARRGYSRDHRGDCKQIVLALVVTREGFPLAHYTLAGNTQDVQTVQKIVTAIEGRFGKSRRVWVMDRGMMSEENLEFLSQPGRHYLIGTRRSELAHFRDELCGQAGEDRDCPARQAAGDVEMEDGRDPRRAFAGRGVSVEEQLPRLVAGGVLGDVHAVDGGGESLPDPQERTLDPPDVAPVRRPCGGPRDGLRAGVRLVEDAGPLGQAGRLGDADPQAGPGPPPSHGQTAAHEPQSDPPRVGQDPDWRHRAGRQRRAAVGAPPGGPADAGAGADPGGVEIEPA